MGPLTVARYFTQSLPLATRYYQRDFYNFSLTTLATRLFEGVDFPPNNPHFYFSPLTYAPAAAAVLRPLVIVLAVGGGLFLTRHRSLECAIGVMVCVSIAASPTSWTHYLTLTLLPIAILLGSLHEQSWPSPLTRRTIGLLALLAIPADLWLGLVLRIGPLIRPPDTYWSVVPSVLSLMPIYLLLGLAVVGSIADREGSSSASDTVVEDEYPRQDGARRLLGTLSPRVV